MSPDIVTIPELVQMLRAACVAEGGQKRFAIKHGIAQSIVSDVLNSNREIPDSIAGALGLIRPRYFLKARRTECKSLNAT